MKIFLLPLLAVIVGTVGSSSARAESIVQTFPDLEKFVYTEKSSKTYFGFGVSPVTLIGSKIGLGLNLFQLHYIKDQFDIELFSATFGTAFGSQNGSEQYFLFRTIPKYRIFSGLSVGPMLGLEFVSFSDVTARLNKNVSPTNDLFAKPQKFSSMGVVYGAAASESFTFGKSSLIKLNEMFYKETYSYTGTNNGWNYYFDQQNLNVDPSPIAPSTVFMLEISFLY